MNEELTVTLVEQEVVILGDQTPVVEITNESNIIDVVDGPAVAIELTTPQSVIEIFQLGASTGGGEPPVTGFTPADISDYDATHLYFGYTGTPWSVRRVLRTGSGREVATAASNPAYTNLTLAWADRATLDYEVMP